MKPLSFYPGPSKIYPQVGEYLKEAFDSGILEQNHRSGAFMSLLEDTIRVLKLKLDIPADYRVILTSSATECWEISIQSLIRGRGQFLYNGAFGKKWFEYAVVNPQVNATGTFPRPLLSGTRFAPDQEARETGTDPENDILCLVDNETSNGTQVNGDNLAALGEGSPAAVLMVDATSSFGGVAHDFSKADVWFASFQKCLGLPSGMGIMLLSPRAISLARAINERNHYNSLLNILENFEKYQTHHTPNILNVFLLNRLMHTLSGIRDIDAHIRKRAGEFYRFIEEDTVFEPLIRNRSTRSDTVFAVRAGEEQLTALKKRASEHGIVIGNGYGEWKDHTFRIANFPAISDEDFDRLKEVLKGSF